MNLWTGSRVLGAELLQIVDAVSREKGLSKEKVLEAMELAIQKSGNIKYGFEYDIRASIDKRTGDVALLRVVTVKEIVEDEYKDISLEDAQKKDQNAIIGHEFTEELPVVDFGRICAQTGRSIISQKIREAEREKLYEEFKSKIGEIISGVVKRVDYSSITIDLNKIEVSLRKEDLIPNENFRIGDRIRAYIVSVNQEGFGSLLSLSRVHPNFVAKLFAQEVPEIYDGIIEIKSIARDPGSRSKMAVYTSDSGIDPVGACVGVRGSRIQGIIQELQGEKIDVIMWSDDLATFAVNAIAPAEVIKVVIDEEKKRFEILVPDEQLSLAIGRRGQNVRLVSQLTGWKVDVVSESLANERSNKDYHEKSKVFMDCLNCDEVLSHLLVTEGFTSVEELAYVELEELSSIDGFDEVIAQELQNRALEFLKKKEEANTSIMKDFKVKDDLKNLDGLNSDDVVFLAKNGIVSLNDFADLCTDELVELLPTMQREMASDLIMKAREGWFKDDGAG